MQIQYSLARELLVKHEPAGMLRIDMEFVHQNSGLLAAGSNQRMQLRFRVPLHDPGPPECVR